MAVYLVSREGAPKGELPRMVEARTQASAISHVARGSFAAIPLTLKEAVMWSKKGIELEDPKDEGSDPKEEAED